MLDLIRVANCWTIIVANHEMQILLLSAQYLQVGLHHRPSSMVPHRIVVHHHHHRQSYRVDGVWGACACPIYVGVCVMTWVVFSVRRSHSSFPTSHYGEDRFSGKGHWEYRSSRGVILPPISPIRYRFCLQDVPYPIHSPFFSHIDAQAQHPNNNETIQTKHGRRGPPTLSSSK